MVLRFINIFAVLYLCGFHPVQSCTLPENDNEPEKTAQGKLVQNAEQTPYLAASGTSGRIAKGAGTRSMDKNTPRAGSRGSNTGSVLKGGNYGRFKRTVCSGLRYSSKGLDTKRCQELMQKVNCFECCKRQMGTKGLPEPSLGREKRGSDSPSQEQGRRSETSSPSGRKSGKRISRCLNRPLWRKKSVPEESKNDLKENNNPAAKESSHRCTSEECCQECDKCLKGCGKCLGGTGRCCCKCLGGTCKCLGGCFPYLCCCCLICTS